MPVSVHGHDRVISNALFNPMTGFYVDSPVNVLEMLEKLSADMNTSTSNRVLSNW